MPLDLIKKRAQFLRTPKAVQEYLYTFDYNPRPQLQSAVSSILTESAHCLEGVFVAAAILEYHGFEPWCLSFESQDGLDHCLFVFQNEKGQWGSIGKSRDRGLHGRPPQFKTLDKLVKSYEEPYIDHSGRIKAWQIAHLDEIPTNWRHSTKNVWAYEKYLLEIKHHPFRTPQRTYQSIKSRYLRTGEMRPQKNWWYPK